MPICEDENMLNNGKVQHFAAPPPGKWQTFGTYTAPWSTLTTENHEGKLDQTAFQTTRTTLILVHKKTILIIKNWKH